MKRGGNTGGINSVTVVRNNSSEVYGVFRALYSSSRLFLTYLCFLRADYVHQTENKLVRHSSNETRLKAVNSTYNVPRNIMIFTGFSSTALLTCR